MFERRKKAEGLNPEAARELHQARGELQQIEAEQEKAAIQEGALVNQAGRLGKELRAREEQFRAEGGELYLRRQELEAELEQLKAQKAATEAQWRELLAGPLPLLLVDSLLGEVEQQARRETEICRARALQDALEARDREVLALLESENGDAESVRRIARILEVDREQRIGLAKEPLILDAEDGLRGVFRQPLKPFISRTYFLNHDDRLGTTNLEPGYFSKARPEFQSVPNC